MPWKATHEFRKVGILRVARNECVTKSTLSLKVKVHYTSRFIKYNFDMFLKVRTLTRAMDMSA